MSSKNPTYPDAHPTAPGGMSEKALAKELIEKHGYEAGAVAKMKWPEKIDAVCQERLNREAEVKQIAVEESMFTRTYDEQEYGTALIIKKAEQDPSIEDMFADLDEDADLPPWDDDAVPVSIEAEIAKYGAQPEDYTEPEPEPESDEVDDFDALMAELDDGLMDEALAEIDHLKTETSKANNKPKHVPSWRKDPGCPQCGHATHGDLGCPDMSVDCDCTFVRPTLLTKIPGVLDYVFNGHMGAGPSASERWINCTASLGASRAFLETLTPNQQAEFAIANIAARQGTTAHAAAEAELLTAVGRMDQDELDTTLMELSIHPDTAGEAYDEEMAEYITEYVDLMRQYALDRGEDHVLVEHRVSAVVPLVGLHEGEVYEVKGTADGVALPTETDPDLAVADLKYGNGIDVEVEDNSQVRICALGVLDSMADEDGNLIVNVETITYYIVQPRLGGLKTYTETLDDLLDWRDNVLSPALTKALYGQAEGATFEPSDAACQWCPARGTCSALAEQRIEQAQDLFDVVVDDEFSTGALTDGRLGELLAQAKAVRDIYDDLKDEAQRRLHRGRQVPGFHLVNYSPPRYWADGAVDALDPMLHQDEGAVLAAKHRALLWTKPEVVSPTQAVKILKANGIKEPEKELGDLIVVPDKKPVVAPVNDRRSKWEGLPPEQMFDIETGD